MTNDQGQTVRDYFGLRLGNHVRLLVPWECSPEVMVLSRREIYPIPGMGDACLGVYSHQIVRANGHSPLLWVVDLADWLSDLMGFQPPVLSQTEELTVVVITDNSKDGEMRPKPQLLGLVVSGVVGKVSLSPEEVEPLPPKAKPVLAPYCTGWARIDGGKMAAILNLPALWAATAIVH
ncbi:MAG TPA: chemotaxis protein CheW [Oscillatoriaceae cyanobacterium M33_DOE_052]|uniref:CheW-like domain-containing protein n=1 Tax=Planktothricoides sp. SpSt-374 TaxID=2282167 RepID=A0A7C3VN44_9CYAN|nr:chemotaxis protein CheW [Oscillatoriaceae cyanobacterium M33_DOE_052]